MKRRTRSFVYKVLRSGKRLFADQGAKRVRIISVAFDDTEVNEIMVVDCGMEIDSNVQLKDFNLGQFKKLNENGTELGKSKELNMVGDDHGDGDNVSRIKRYGVIYTRKRKRSEARDSGLKRYGFDKVYRRKKKVYRRKKKVKVSLESGFDGKYGSRKGPFIFAASRSYDSKDGSMNICRFSCFVSSVLRYLKVTKMFSWRHFSSFLVSEPSSSIYSSTASRILQDSTCTTSHGLFKVFGSIHSIPLFTLNINSIPFCFLYIHSNLLLKHAFLTYSYIEHITNMNATNNDFKLPLSGIPERNPNPPSDKVVPTKKSRSARRRIPRVSFSPSKNIPQLNAWLHVESSVPVPRVREVTAYAEEDYIPFMLPESYITARGDELSRTLEKSCVVYDIDSDDEQWLKDYNHDGVSEDVFEKIIDAFERGIYCSPHEYSEAASAADRCLELASKEVLEDVYSYWMVKRKKKRSALVKVFQYYKQKRVKQCVTSAVSRKKRSSRVKQHVTSAVSCKKRSSRVKLRVTSTVSRKKRSSRRRSSQRVTEKQLDLKKAKLNDEKLLEESLKVSIKAQEAQEAAKRSEEASIIKRQRAQALMEAADLAVYRATMALRIAEEACAAGGAVEVVTGAIFGSLLE